MTLFDRLEDSASESGEPAWITVGNHMLVIGWLGDTLCWVLDGELLTRDEARKIVQTFT